MRLNRDLHLAISRKLHNSVSVKVFAHRTDRGGPPQRVCLGTLHMPEQYMRVFRNILEHGAIELGGAVTVGGSYFSASGDAMRSDEVLASP